MVGTLSGIGRRGVIKGGIAAIAAETLIYPTRSWGKSENPVKIGMVDPQAGTYGGLGPNEIRGAHMAVDQINSGGGVLGRPVQLVVKNDRTLAGRAVSKAQVLLRKDRVHFLMGGVSSAASTALSNLARKSQVLYVDTGGHVDSLTGSDCHWTTFRTCTSTSMLAAANFHEIFNKLGKRWYFLTPNYSYGHALEREYSSMLKKAGGKRVGSGYVPLGTTDFSTYLTYAKGANADVLIVLVEGDDLVNALKEIVQFGLNEKMPVAGALMEMEVEEALPQDTLIGHWNYEWYWKQPNVPAVKKFVEEYKNHYSGGKVPTARVWFGFASAHAIAMAANQAKSLDPVKVAKKLEGLELPPHIALQPGKVHYRHGDHQMMANEFPGYIPGNTSYPDMFTVTKVVPAKSIARSPSSEGCNMSYPG